MHFNDSLDLILFQNIFVVFVLANDTTKASNIYFHDVIGIIRIGSLHFFFF